MTVNGKTKVCKLTLVLLSGSKKFLNSYTIIFSNIILIFVKICLQHMHFIEIWITGFVTDYLSESIPTIDNCLLFTFKQAFLK